MTAPAPNAQGEAKVDIITPHITDGYHLEIPYFLPPFYKEVCIGRHVGEHGCEPLWQPFHIGSFEVNLSPTKHVVMLLLAALIVTALLVGAARAHVRHTHAIGRPKGFASAIEATVLYMRNEVILPNVGHTWRALRPVPAHRVLLHPHDEPARSGALRIDRDGEHRGDGNPGYYHVHRGRSIRDDRVRAPLPQHDLLLEYGARAPDAYHHVPDPVAGGADRQIHQADRARHTTFCEHDGRSHRGTGLHWHDLHVQVGSRQARRS